MPTASELKSVIVKFGVQTRASFDDMLRSVEGFSGTVDEIEARVQAASARLAQVAATTAALEAKKALLVPECRDLEARVAALKKAIAAVSAVSL